MSTRLSAMPAHDFRSALEEAGLSCADFAAIVDEPVDHITRMMLGMDRAPYQPSLIATVLTAPAARELALLHAEVDHPEERYIEPR